MICGSDSGEHRCRRSQPARPLATLAASVDRLAGVETVFVINRLDYPAELVAADEAVLTGAGFEPGTGGRVR